MNEFVQLVMADDYDDLSRRGAALITECVKQKFDTLLCAASGSSPLGTYAELARIHSESPTIFSTLRVIKLDEWGPLAPDDPASCEVYVRAKAVEPLGITEDRYITVRGDAGDPDAECRRYAAVVNGAGPIDVSILGMGTNGHLGLNEPAAWLHDTVHVAELAKESQGHGMLAEARTQPTYGLTLGMGDILRSKLIVLLVSGANKRDAMTRLLSRQITTQFPASFLWIHRNTVIIADREACPNQS